MELNELLHQHDLRNTAIRRKVLSFFVRSQHALSHSMLERKLAGEFDRVTLYRTLKSFEENGLIHRVINDDEHVQYALCQHQGCHQERHLDNHVHFKCEICELTYCLDEVEPPQVSLPDNYRARDYQFLIIGTCDQCA